MKLNYKKIIMFILGNLVLGIGVGLCNISKLGTDPMAVLVAGLTASYPFFSFSIWNGIVYAILLSIAIVVHKKQVSVFSIIALFVSSFGISLVPELSLKLNYLYLVSGTVLMSLGIALAAKPDIGRSPYDAFIFSFMNRFKLKYSIVRWTSDIVVLVIGYVLGGTVGIGTALAFVFIGKLVEFFLNILDKVNLD